MKTTKRAVLLLCACLAASAVPASAEIKAGDQQVGVFLGGDKVVGQQHTNYDIGVLTGADYFVYMLPQVGFGVEGRFEEPGQKTVSLDTSPRSPAGTLLPQQDIRYKVGGAAALLRFNFTPKSNGTPYALLGYSGNYTLIENKVLTLTPGSAAAVVTGTQHYWRGGGIAAFGYEYVGETGMSFGLEARAETYDKANQMMDLLFRVGYKF